MKQRNIFNRIRQRIHEHSRSEVLAKFINDNQYKSYVEIGVWKGETIEYLLKHTDIQKVYLVDPYDTQLKYGKGKINTATQEELNKAKQEMLSKTSPFSQWVDINYLFMLSIHAARLLKENKFDIVFIDGNHQYEYVKEDINLWLPKITQNGMLTGHDYNNRWKEDVVKAVDEIFKEKVNVEDDAVWYIKK